MTTQHIVCFEILTQEFYAFFEYTLQEGAKLKIFNIFIIQVKYGIIIYHTVHIIENIVQEYWGTNKK